ncbi:DISARM system phospholipase D-like protein DrmC [Micromonospora sp. WMMD1120]|uniref:DISARM system phospholipase D-like protein DrmC n=1 Tax=Micromonospora sp. WMMD1120 TaxID=3016106 RepID=UPI0024174F35|nr:DISARM system phospholipase D-like protein DrmC [Micromonospora sp. WMMD1120]MDG4807229.1 DISARM system phospholipase D-like protein DrmC [Micromonospora sp. WMMD1120]
MSHQAFAEIVADIAADLPDGHLAAWCNVLSNADAGNEAVEAALIDARPGYAIATHARRLVTAWRTEAFGLPGAALALALRTAALVHRQAVAHRAELVVSGPISAAVPVRLTSSVVIEVIRAARASLLVVSFAAYGVPEVVAELVAAASRGVQVDLVLESSAEDGGTLRGSSGASAAFRKLDSQATFWHWPARTRFSAGASRPAMHAKIVAADSATALVSSSNLTDRGLSDNLEVGVVLHDPEVVRRLVQHFATLMIPRIGPLRRLR